MEPSRDFWRNRPVFITGATGLLGSELTRYLVDAGADVVALMRDHVPHSRFAELELERKVKTVGGELEDLTVLERTLNEYEIDTVFHLGAQTIVGTAERGPWNTFEANVRGSYNLLEACRRQSFVKRVVVASSDKAYGTQSQLPYSEATPLQGRAPYDASKSCTDLIAASYHFTYGTPVCVTRCGNFFGPGDLNFNRLIPGTIRSLHYGDAPVVRSDGKYVRDYIFVGDGALAYIDLAEQMEKKNLYGEAFNFSYGEKRNVLQVIEAVSKVMGRSQLKPQILNQAQKEIPAQYLSSEKAQKILGWKPTFEFAAGLEKTVAWYMDYFKRHSA